jgi:site-specific recombinase XerD
MIHLAYFLGLRPVEISRITLDDISFKKGELTLPNRKGHNPTTLPIPEQTIKALAAYVLNVRPQNEYRNLFLNRYFPYKPLGSCAVIHSISKSMKQAGLSSTTYWLRHTYAQQLLETGTSIFEIKEMLGHDNIESSKTYLHIDINLMRKVLFDETL